MIKAVLFDLGNTLVQYWERPAFPGVLREAIAEVEAHLRQQGLLRVSPDVVAQRTQEHNHELPGHRVYPLAQRLALIFGLDETEASSGLLEVMCRRFTVPIFARGRLYPDALPVLEALRARGFRTGIVSNTPWGSPAALWREQISRFGLRERVDVDVFCDDVGWRKPARQVFEFALDGLGVPASECLFVGDDPRWDLVGPRALGMQAVWIDRLGAVQEAEEVPIRNLSELWDRLAGGYPPGLPNIHKE